MSRGRGLAPLVGAGMAAVAAGSLVMFSLLAQQTALSPAPGDALLPRGPEGAERPAVVVPAPEPSRQGRVDESAPVPFVATSFVSPPPTNGGSTIPPEDVPGDGPSENETLLASLDLDIQISEAVDLRGPLFDLRPHGRVPGDGDPKDEPKRERECPGRPAKPRSPGEHPHGGPPACGNPHGEPPGVAKSDEARGAHGGAEAESLESTSSSGTHGETTRSSGSNGGSSGSTGGGGAPPSHSSSEGSSGSGGADHPHGAPPGQAKKESSSASSGGNSGSRPEHPHGAPPGQAKK